MAPRDPVTRVHLIPLSDGSWELRETAAGPAVQGHPDRDEALESARVALQAAGGGQVVVHVEVGAVAQVLVVRAPVKRPWWYIQPRPIAVILGVVLVALGVWGFNGGQITPFLIGLKVVIVILGSAHLIALGLSWNWRRTRLG